MVRRRVIIVLIYHLCEIMCVLLLLQYILVESFGELFGGQSFTDSWRNMMFQFV